MPPALDAAELVSAALGAFQTDEELRAQGTGAGPASVRRRRAAPRSAAVRVDRRTRRDRDRVRVVRGSGSGDLFLPWRGFAAARRRRRGSDCRAAPRSADGGTGADGGAAAGGAAARGRGGARVARGAHRGSGRGPGHRAAVRLCRAGGRLVGRPTAQGASRRRGAVVGHGGAWSGRRFSRCRCCGGRCWRPGCRWRRRGTSVPLMRHAVVRPLLELVRAADSGLPLDEDTAVFLLSGPLGGADPLALRRLRRGLRRLELASGGERGSGALLVEALESGDVLAALEDGAARPVRHVGALLATARESIAACDGVETVLWKLWQASGLEAQLVARSTRSGPVGVQADRDLDAVMVLFDAAARYHERLPGAQVGAFVDYLAAQQIVGDTLAPDRAARRLGFGVDSARFCWSRVDSGGRAERAGGELAGSAVARLAAGRRAAASTWSPASTRTRNCPLPRRFWPRSGGCCWSRRAGREETLLVTRGARGGRAAVAVPG